MKRPARQLYAILREDIYEDLDVHCVIVTAIWTEMEKAKAEAARPLWGVRFHPGEADNGVQFERLREVDTAERERFIARLLGKTLQQAQ